MRVLIATAPFKESADAQTISRLVATTVSRVLSNATIQILNLTDGGTGFAQWTVNHSNGSYRYLYADRLDGVTILTRFGTTVPGTAIVETAQILGVALVPHILRKPLLYSSTGVGQVIRAALELGYDQVVLGCGDSGICDAGIGAATALGFQFLDARGNPVPLNAQGLMNVSTVSDNGLTDEVRRLRVSVVGNTNFAWCGATGAMRLFGAQKGLSDAEVVALDDAYSNLATIVARERRDPRTIAGAGASGGLAGLLASLLNAEIVSYVTYICAHVDLESAVMGSDLIITGEGGLDRTTLMGKLPAYVAETARRHGVPCIAVVGRYNHANSSDSLFSKVVQLSPHPLQSDLAYASTLSRLDELLGEALKEYRA